MCLAKFWIIFKDEYYVLFEKAMKILLPFSLTYSYKVGCFGMTHIKTFLKKKIVFESKPKMVRSLKLISHLMVRGYKKVVNHCYKLFILNSEERKKKKKKKKKNEKNNVEFRSIIVLVHRNKLYFYYILDILFPVMYLHEYFEKKKLKRQIFMSATVIESKY